MSLNKRYLTQKRQTPPQYHRTVDDMQIKIIHRYISLIFATLWAFQALTGCLIVFRWELDDAGVPGKHVTFDRHAMGARLDALVSEPDTQVSSVWAATGRGDRFDIFYSRAGQDRTLRVDGHGKTLRDRNNATLSDGNIYDRLSDLHMALMLGDAGRAFLGFSGLLLLSNLALGLKLAWPRAGQWMKALRAPKGKTAMPLLYGWHRTLGLWLCVPAILTVTAGALLAFDDGLASLLKADIPQPQTPRTVFEDKVGRVIAPSQALNAALDTYPGATLSGFSTPKDKAPWYRVRLRAAGEMPRIWGMTTVYIDAGDGHVLNTYDARQTHGPARMLLDTLYPLHTGQIGGVAGRIVQLLIGLWLTSMIGLGISLWWTRKRLMKQPIKQ
ncbi:PepSY-associated TM helix domain-containing protein [Asticcacaulis sp. 201]|uniref:PepSY-associated TM helix domain-containing protein n=1 Tax=Asticcacaulis sp. 201 TaxID=3028787 RepID=UPI00291628EC|nr:PepSY-associated TM helix domain-containing protein [Asticcacaulis sp. 201]MDV6330734.1 PepSY-associated TM helix domain-containing protein [Asticcacaulis sp. 201]